jgi:hypothetical protein
MGVPKAAGTVQHPTAAIQHGTQLAIFDGGYRVLYCASRA